MTRPAADKERRSTIHDIARLADVSARTVSRVLNDSPLVNAETRARVHAVMAEADYEPDPRARALAFRRSFLVGFIYDNPNPQYVLHMLAGLLAGVKGTGFEVTVHPREGDGEDLLAEVRAFVQRAKPAGIVLPPRLAENDDLARMLEDLDCPHIRIASAELAAPERMIVTREREASVAVGEHLADLGHERVGHVAGPASYRSARERLAGFEAGLKGRGLALDPALVIEGQYDFDSGVACGRALLDRPDRPTAIYAANDEMAAGVLQAALDLKLRTPEDLSIVGYDDFDIASRLRPALTTVRNPIREVGRIASTRLVALAMGRPAPIEQPPPPTLVVRASSGPRAT